MFFKGKQVFIAVDEHGKILNQNGRAVMKYKIDDDKTYNPSVNNISNSKGTAQSPKRSTKPASTAPGQQSMFKTETQSADTIIAYTDGGCIGNPGPSGLGYVIRYPDGTVHQKGEPLGQGTNNIAELTAILRVLQDVTDKSKPLYIHTDSSYSIGVLTKGWKAKANQQLIAVIKAEYAQFPNIKLIKVKGHAGNPDNELVDTLANTAARTQQEQTA